MVVAAEATVRIVVLSCGKPRGTFTENDKRAAPVKRNTHNLVHNQVEQVRIQSMFIQVWFLQWLHVL